MNQQFWDGQTDFPTQKPKMETISIILPHRSAIGRVCEENMQKEVNMSSTVHCNALSVERKTHLWFDLDLGRPGPLHLLIHTSLYLTDSQVASSQTSRWHSCRYTQGYQCREKSEKNIETRQFT